MKKLLLVVALVGLSGCAVYSPGYDPYGMEPMVVAPSVVAPSVYLYGGTSYRYRDYDPGYYAPFPHHRTRPRHYDRHRDRDRDRDGVPDRFDRDRDGDGVPNRWDRRPGDPRYQ